MIKLTRRIIQTFRTLTPYDYLMNYRRASLCRKINMVRLKALPKANQGSGDETDYIRLMGIPKHEYYTSSLIKNTFLMYQQYGADLIFLQIDPSYYIARYRFLAHKCALGKTYDYREDGVILIDPHIPITWYYTVVNLLSMDMMINNYLPQNINYCQGLFTYSYPYLQEYEITKALTPRFVDAIGEKILGGQRSNNPLIDRYLYTSLMGKQKVLLGDIPESLYKMILGGALSIHELRDIFRTVVMRNKELTTPFSIRGAAECFMPHIFLLPKDLYMTALLKESFQAAMQLICCVGVYHFEPIQHYWVGPPHGINMTDATTIPAGFEGENVEDLIEKQAIMDVLLETRTWAKPYLSNPFPYIFYDITTISESDLSTYKLLFAKHYHKYSYFKRRYTKLLPAEYQILLSSTDHYKQRLYYIDQMKDDMKSLTLSHVKQKMSIQLDSRRSISSYF